MKKKKLLFTVVISTVLLCSCSSNTNETTTLTTTEVTTITTKDVKQESISNSVTLSDFLTRLNKNLKNSKLYENVDFVQHEAEYYGKSEDGGDTYNINIMDNLIVSCIVKNNDITSMMVVAKPVDTTSNVKEQQANVFARDILMPAVVINQLAHSADDIAALCNVSKLSADIRWQRLIELRQRNKFGLHHLERQVYSNFYTYIRNIKKVLDTGNI